VVGDLVRNVANPQPYQVTKLKPGHPMGITQQAAEKLREKATGRSREEGVPKAARRLNAED